jgi:hypothetical protein
MDSFWALIGSIAFGLVALGLGLRIWDRAHEGQHAAGSDPGAGLRPGVTG